MTHNIKKPKIYNFPILGGLYYCSFKHYKGINNSVFPNEAFIIYDDINFTPKKELHILFKIENDYLHFINLNSKKIYIIYKSEFEQNIDSIKKL